MKRQSPSATELEVRRIGVGGIQGQVPLVELELSGARTVLVGKNGAGKSLIMAAAVEGARAAVFSPTSLWDECPRKFRCDIGTRAHSFFTYEYELEPLKIPESQTTADSAKYSWREYCKRPNGDLIWKVEDRKLYIGRQTFPMIGGMGFLSFDVDMVSPPPPEWNQLHQILLSFRLVPAGVVRQHDLSRPVNRTLILTSGRNKNGKVTILPRPSTDRLDRLSRAVTMLHERQRGKFEELQEVLARVGLGKLTVNWFTPEMAARDDANSANAFAFVSLDGTNIGLLADGTLRICETLCGVLASDRGVIWLEEPETGLHPGLLERLLNEVHAYSADRQVVISTHSPYVVNWCEPADLRLVERHKGSTTVRSLSVTEVTRIHHYLQEDGSLDEYIFSPESQDS
jgi:ABC-type cobalamin/Fe3+-siderophores transport system ATPase subunit